MARRVTLFPIPEATEKLAISTGVLALALFGAWGLFGCGQPVQRTSASQSIPMEPPPAPARGPLRLRVSNARYFADDSGKAVYLTGSHTWNNFQDWGTSDPPPVFDYQKYLDFLVRHGHNFFRLYVWEQAAGVPWTNEEIWFRPMPYQRTGPGLALDGKPRFDLRRWNPEYFERLRARVREAGDRGIYVSVMLFNGWSVDNKSSAMSDARRRRGLGNPWRGHPFNRANNINGIDAALVGDDEGIGAHTLHNPNVTELQKAYVRKVIDTVGDLDNVLWEISNESDPRSTAWEYEMIRLIKSYEASRPKQHPVGMTAEFPNALNADLFQSPADWISPASLPKGDYALDPPAATHDKVIVTDTDHIWGLGGDSDWAWKSFLRGLNPIFMDPYEADVTDFYPVVRAASNAPRNKDPREVEWEKLRLTFGHTSAFAARLNLAAAEPRPDLASTGYCLANPRVAYLVYSPEQHYRGERFFSKVPSTWFPDQVSVDLSQIPGTLAFEWFGLDGAALSSGTAMGGQSRVFRAPRRGGGLVLYIYRPEPNRPGPFVALTEPRP